MNEQQIIATLFTAAGLGLLWPRAGWFYLGLVALCWWFGVLPFARFGAN
jgi:hypothetical protein